MFVSESETSLFSEKERHLKTVEQRDAKPMIWRLKVPVYAETKAGIFRFATEDECFPLKVGTFRGKQDWTLQSCGARA
jgi:hypothetical protein